MTTEYISLDVLAVALGLPRGYLQNLATTGHIPFLDVNGRKRFDEQQVREALTGLAASSTSQQEVSNDT